METKCDKEIIPNTWGDLRDINLNEKTFRATDEGIIETELDLALYDKVIDSLGAIYLGKSYGFENGKVIAGEDDYRLNTYISKIPHGIVDKKRPGIGATTLEIDSKRNSIIVVPTKTLAYNKVINNFNNVNCQYVGSKIDSNRGATTKQEIISYLNDNSIKYKKFIVVADSLEKRVINLLEKVLGKDIYDNYFLMVDEVDMLQSDANYRPRLEDVMDIYFRFNKKNRCLLTATMMEFSNHFLQYETRFDLTDYKPKRNLNLIHTNNINALVKREIEKHTNDDKKVLIAYNSIIQILGIIFNLNPELQKKCAIICSDASEKEAGGYYAVLNNNKLPNKIVFMTCSYFAGVDIEDTYHLITVSNAERFFQVLSIDRMTQIAGRCRIEKGILSETIIYNTPKDRFRLNDGTFQEYLLNRAHKIIELYNAADEISKYDNDLKMLFKIVKKAIQEKSTEKVGGEEITLTRPNIAGDYVPAYFNIDSIVEKKILDSGYYMIPSMLKDKLSETHNIISYESVLLDKKQSQEEAEEKSNNRIKEQFDSYIEEAIALVKQLEAHGKLNDEELKKLLKYAKRNTKDFYERFMKLYKYADNDLIINLLWEIRAENKKSFKDINNSVIFWALEDNHPIKSDLSNSLIIGNVYLASELHEILKPILEYHLHRIIKPRGSISLIKAFYTLKRPRSKYRVIANNPKGFTEHKMRISKDENLIGLLLL